MLQLGRNDVILACPLWVGTSLNQTDLSAKELVEVHKFTDTRLELHFACKKSEPYSQEIINIVDERLPLLIRDGTLDKILESFHLPKVTFNP